MQGDPGEASKPPGKEKKCEPSAGASKEVYPSIVVSRGRSEPRRAARKKEERIGAAHEDGAGEGKRSRGRRWTRKERDRERDRDDFGGRRSREFNRSEFGQNFVGLPEDSRISTILRKLAREDDERKFASLIKLLQDALALPDNVAYIRRSLDMILDSLFELVSGGSSQQCRCLAAKTLGNVGFALEKECKKFIDWMYDKYKSETDGNTKKLITVGIQELVELDAQEKKLADHVQTLMERVGQIMDTTDCGDIFTTTVKLTLSLIHRYPELVSNHFQDTVDVLLGWHFEMTQPRSVTECAGKALTVLAPYWVQDLQFTYTLLNDFLEDIVSTKSLLFSPLSKEEVSEEKAAVKDPATSEEVIAPNEKQEIPSQTRIQRITSILLVISSVMKNLLKHFAPVIPPPVTVDFLNVCLEKIIQNVTEIMHFAPILSSNIVSAGNKCVKHIVTVLGNDVQNVTALMEFVANQQRLSDHLSLLKNQIHFSLIAKITVCVDTAVTTDSVDLLLSPGSVVQKARLLSPSSKAFSIYENLLKNKTIHVILRSYAHIVGDLDAALRSIKPDLPPFHEFGTDNPHLATVYELDDVQPVIIFNLAALRELVTNSNPMVSLLTLKPTLFEILAERMPQVISPYRHPRVHLLYLSILREHCIMNDYFEETVQIMETVASQTQSLAEALGVPSISGVPTPKRNYYVSAIIYLLTRNIAQRLDDDNKLLLVAWTHEILLWCQNKGESLEESPDILDLIFNFFCASADYRPKIALACIPVLKLVAFNQSLLVPSKIDGEVPFFSCTRGIIILKLIDLCFYYLNSSDDKVRKEYHLLMSSLPAAILTFVTRNHIFMNQCSIVQLIANNYEDMVLYYGAIDSHVFREFMNYILEGICFEKPFVWKMNEFMERSYKAYDEHGIEVKRSVGCIMEWMTFQAAKYCIENRFRTVYGKALGTFCTIEETIRQLANETASMLNLGDHPASPKRARLLVQFVEHLEKLYYNAVEGTACAFQPISSKTTKSFFQTNRVSCSEWFSRSRCCLLVIALYAGMSAWAVRHGYSLLQHLVETKATQTPEFEATILNTGLALAYMGEREAVHGLHQWAREISGSPHSELRPLIDMAARKYESAADKFEDLVADISASNSVPKLKVNGIVEKRDSLPITVKTFVADQLTECYLALSSWDELSSWKKREAEFLANENGDSSRKYEYVTANFADGMSKFDSGDLNGAADLLVWDENRMGSDLFAPERPTWHIAHMLDETDFILRNIFVKKCCDPYYTLEALSSFGSAQTLAENVIEDTLKDSSSEILAKACSLKYIAHAIINRGNSLITELFMNEAWWKMYVSSPDMERIAWWADALEKLKKPQAPNESLKYYLLQVIKASRKAGNVRYTTKCLLNYLGQPSGGRVFHGDLAEECLVLPVEPAEAPALHQLSKLLRSTCDTVMSVRLSTHVSAGLFESEQEENQIVNSEVLRDLSKIFAAEMGHYDQLVSEQLKRVISTGISKVTDPKLLIFEELCDRPRNESIIPLPNEDTIVGKILLASVGSYDLSLKSWESLAGWCYEMGGKVSSQIWIKDPELYGGQATLNVISSYHSVGVDVDRASSESLEEQIRDLCIHSPEEITAILTNWKRDNDRVYSFFRLAVHSYFKFLTISPYEENNCKFVAATLRLLRLMVKHSTELRDVVDLELVETPVHPWIPIVPQLLARLNHADPYIRKKVEELLVKIGLESPHLIIFPAVVGSGAMPTTKLFPMMKTYENKKDIQVNEDEEDEDDEDREDDEDLRGVNERAAMMENSFHSILDSLAVKYSEEIAQVKMFVCELQRITLLWDELWLGALLQHQGDINKRFSSLQSEIKSTQGNGHLDQETKDCIIKEKYRLILKPILFIFEQLNEITSVAPETPREKQFQEQYTESIQKILSKLREPADSSNPNDVWDMIQALQHSLQEKSRHRSGANLTMSDISTTLSKLERTKIFMPGVRGRRSPPTIEKVENNVAILPTKTKPKKLIFRGSDGENYTYLFKGLEDLHLDERIMQFLSIANSMLKESHLQAHFYSVVPLGPRSGLISWVENVTPIFSLYKKWQQREASKASDEVCRSVMRPSELFSSKLAPILMEHNIANVDQNQRHKWPIAALRKCLQELMSATPANLLYQELWAHSVNGAHWWRTLKTYSSSLAVMSMIGYIIGLGDRHLDNVLVNLKTGEVVHIDYNVCFEKGKTLRVPEKVPFRLTPNLMAALGVTGVEGVYKQTCEHVLRVMREGQETLLTLLEAFVYDPLIDWTPFSEGGYTGAVYGGGRELASDMKVNKKELMKEVACSMFKVRLTESKYNWMENKKTLVTELGDLMELMKSYMCYEKEKRKIQDLVKERHTQLALLKEAEGQPKHSLYNLHTRYSHYLQVYTAKEAVCQKLHTKMKECEAIDSQYHAVMENLKGTDLANWIAEVRGRPKEDVCQVFDLIKEFLSNAGQSQTVLMCVYSEKTVGDLCLQQSTSTLQLLDMLRDYYEICRHYPRSRLASHRTQLYLNGSKRLLENMSPACCDAVLADFVKAIAVSEEEIMQVSMFSAGLERHLIDTSLRLQKCAERSSEMSRVNITQEVPSGWLAKGGHWGESVDSKTVNKDSKALAAAVLLSLCALNKKFIMIESQATSAGDSLMDLTSQAGDWFLHDMCSIAGLIVKTAQLLPQASSTSDDTVTNQIGSALKCINHAHNQLKVLQEMYDNFMGIILIEAMQDQISEEQSVVRLVDRLSSLISSLPMPISEILKSLSLHLRYTVMNIAVGRQEGPVNSSSAYPTQHGAVMPLVETLRADFEALLAPSHNEANGELYSDMRVPDHGDMLLMGFNGLFNLEPSRNLMVQYFKQLVSPPTWSIVDQIKDPQKYYARPVMDDGVRKILDATFFIKKLETLVEVLRMCRSDAHGFRGGPKAPQVPHDLDSLTKPMRKYIANYILSQILGIFSSSTAILICRLLEQQGVDVTGEVQQKDIGAQGQGNASLEELCRKLMDSRNPELRSASGTVSHVESARKHEDALNRVRRDMTNLQVLTQYSKVTLTAHHWLHDHLLVKTNPHQLHIISRHSFLTEMRRAVQAMHGFQPRLKEAIDQQQNLITSAEQRLKWAAGANPALCEVMCAFEAAVASHKMKIAKESTLAENISSMASSILNYEALRTPTTEAKHHDNAFISIIEDCRQFYELSSKKAVNLSPAEQGLVSLKAPKKKIDADWLAKTEELISASLAQLKQEIEPINKEMFAIDQRIDQKISFIKMTMAKHNQIIPDIKNLLKTLVKCDDSGLVGLDQYMCRYKKFVDTINALTKNLSGSKNKIEPAVMERALDDIATLIKSADSIYSELLGFSTNGGSAVGTDSPRKSIAPKRDVGMVKNAYAIGVWRKVKFKLSGRDPDPAVKSTVKHQVNWTISEATNLDNLALLYEGWTPWV